MTRTEIRDHFQHIVWWQKLAGRSACCRSTASPERRRESEDSFNFTERWFAITVSETK
jgi:hypothetical protein